MQSSQEVRIARDGKPYTYAEFEAWFGRSQGAAKWRAARKIPASTHTTHAGGQVGSMFTLSVRFMDGSSHRLELNPDSTIAGMRAHLERQRSVDPMHEIKLVQGLRELKDGGQIEVEVQALTIPCIEKAITAIIELLPTGAVFYERVGKAIDLLDEVKEVPPAMCERLMAVVMHPPPNTLEYYHNLAVGCAFGRVCGDPEPYLDRLWRASESVSEGAVAFAAGALVEIFTRSKHSLRGLIEALVKCVRRCVQDMLQLGQLGAIHLRAHVLRALFTCTAILGEHGDARDIDSLRRLDVSFLEIRRPLLSEKQIMAWKECYSEAIGLIRSREELDQYMGPNSMEHEERPFQAEAYQETNVRADSAHETEDAASLMQALQNSKQDIPSTGIPLNSDGVVVLRLTRMAWSPQLRKHLRTTPTLEECRKRVADAECEIEPSWGGHAQFFIPLTHEQIAEAELDGVELSFDHVVILNSEVDTFKAALHEFNCKGKKRPKLEIVNFGSEEDLESTNCSTHQGAAQNPESASGSSAACSSSSGLAPLVEGSAEDEIPVEVEPVGSFTLRTDSSLGLPPNPYA